jgi:hypothetical protein
MHLAIAPATAVESPQAFGVDRDELARRSQREGPKAAWWLGKEMAQPVCGVPPKDPVNAARRDTEDRTDPVGSPPALHPQRQDAAFERIARAVWRAMRSARSIGEVRRAEAPPLNSPSTNTHVPCGATDSDALGFGDEKSA